KAWGGTEKAEFGMNVIGCGHGSSPTKPSLDPQRPLEVQCPLVRPRSEQNRSLGRARQPERVIIHRASAACRGLLLLQRPCRFIPKKRNASRRCSPKERCL